MDRAPEGFAPLEGEAPSSLRLRTLDAMFAGDPELGRLSGWASLFRSIASEDGASPSRT